MSVSDFKNAASGVTDLNNLNYELTISAGVRIAFAALSIRVAPSTNDNPSATLESVSPDATIVSNLTSSVPSNSTHQWVWAWYNPPTGADLTVDLSWTTNRDCSSVAWTLTNAARSTEDLQTDSFDLAVDADLEQNVQSRKGGSIISVLTVRTTGYSQINPISGVLIDKIASTGGSSASNVTTAVAALDGDGTSQGMKWGLGTETPNDAGMSSFYVPPSPWLPNELWHRRWGRRLARM